MPLGGPVSTTTRKVRSEDKICHPVCPARRGMPWDRTPDFLLRGATKDHVYGFH
jgi:hypothetical protein